MSTTPDPLSAAVEAYDRTVHCPDAQPQSLADDHRSALSAAITAYIEATGMVTAMRRARTVLAANGQAATPTNVLGALDRAMIAASPTVEVG